MLQPAASSPSPPAATAISRLSVTSWRASRPGVPPRAVRTANSWWRAAARAASRPAMFRHTMSRNTATAAPSSTRGGNMLWPSTSW